MSRMMNDNFNFRVSTDIVAALNEAAARECMSPSAYVRRLVMRELDIGMKPKPTRADRRAA